MGKNLKKLKDYLKETWTRLVNRTTVRRRIWKITETPGSDMNQTHVEYTLNKVYDPAGSVITTRSDNSKEMNNNDHGKIEEGVKGWKAELLKFKEEAEEFNIELEKAMARRRQSISKDGADINYDYVNMK